MKNLKLVALSSGVSKTGKTWFKATVKGKNPNGSTIVQDYWLSEQAGTAAIAAGVKEDDEIVVICDLDDWLKPTVTEILPAEE